MSVNFLKSKLTLAAAAIAAFQAVGWSARAYDKPPIVFMTWGGVWQQTFDKIAKEYEAKTKQPVQVIVQGAGEGGLARVVAQKDKPEIDIWSTNMINYERAKTAGVLASIDKSRIPNTSKVESNLVFSHGVTGWVSLRGIFYRKDLVPFEPTKWEDLWDPRLKGKIAAPGASFDPGYFPTIAALLAGGSEKNLAPGYQKLKSLRPSVLTFYTNNVQSIRLLENGEVGLIAWGVLPNVISYIKPGGNYGFVVPSKPLLIAETPITLIANSPRQKAAEAFVDYLLSKDVQTEIANAFGALPANGEAKGPEVVRSALSNVSGAYRMNYQLLAENMSTIIKDYDQEVVQ